MLESVFARVAWDEAFRAAVVAGLSRPRKAIAPCWLYDERGSQLFEQITRLDDYYPTRTETEILLRHAGEIARFCGGETLLFEYGAGAGIKTEILIAALDRPRLYVPIDIAGDFLARTAGRIGRRFPDLDVFPVVADFNHDFELPELPAGRRTAFFPGSTIGNLNHAEAAAFLRRLRRHVGDQGTAQGTAIVGVDLKKDVRTLLDAYDDREGVTAAFNLNLLARINRELDGDFPLDRFAHEARWNADESAIEMHLVSRDARRVAAGGEVFAFQPGETIHTESSRKYDLERFAALAESTGWRATKVWLDSNRHFAVFGLENWVS
jgi:dimethylhistidine N-methyltransferase